MIRNARQRRGFTLIELVVVMALMTVIMAIAAPRLSDFMSGRTVNEEVRRLIALTHMARSEAIARNERMALWIKPETGEYGLRSEDDQSGEGFNPREYKLADKLAFEMDQDTEINDEGEAIALFWPDGTIDDESFLGFTLLQKDEPQRTIGLSDNRLEYLAQNPS